MMATSYDAAKSGNKVPTIIVTHESESHRPSRLEQIMFIVKKWLITGKPLVGNPVGSLI